MGPGKQETQRQGKVFFITRLLPVAILLVWGILFFKFPSLLLDRQFSPLQIPHSTVFDKTFTIQNRTTTVSHKEFWMHGRLIGSRCRTVFELDPQGIQVRQEELEQILKTAPSTFYHVEGPAHDLIRQLRPLERNPLANDIPLLELKFRQMQPFNAPFRYAIIGLGTGDLACYASPGDTVDFFESNPTIPAALEQNSFTYIEDAKKRGVVINLHVERLSKPGPEGKSEPAARGANNTLSGGSNSGLQEYSLTNFGFPLKTLRELNQKFNLLIVNLEVMKGVRFDLLTQEAVDSYFENLKESGIVAFHATNSISRKLSIIQKLAEAKKIHCYYTVANVNERFQCLFNARPSAWIVLYNRELLLPSWQKAKSAPIDQLLHDESFIRHPRFFLEIADWRVPASWGLTHIWPQ